MKKLQTPWDSDEMLMVDIGCFERGCAMVAGDWVAGEQPECRATVDAEAYERLRAAGRQALDAMDYTRWAVADQTPNKDVAAHDEAMNKLRAALAEDAMQRLTDVQQEMEREPMTDAEMEPLRRRMMMEAYNAADDGDTERYNALKVMCTDVLVMLSGMKK